MEGRARVDDGTGRKREKGGDRKRREGEEKERRNGRGHQTSSPDEQCMGVEAIRRRVEMRIHLHIVGLEGTMKQCNFTLQLHVNRKTVVGLNIIFLWLLQCSSGCRLVFIYMLQNKHIA